MPAPIRSLYSSGTFSMKVAGTAGEPRIQQMGVRQGCPLSPTLFGLSFDGLHDHLHSCAPASGTQLRSGKWVSSLVYADDVVLLSWSASGLQLLLDSLNHFCGPGHQHHQDRGYCFQWPRNCKHLAGWRPDSSTVC